MKIREVENGLWVETLHYGSPSGNYYKLGDFVGDGKTRRIGYKRFTKERILLVCSNSCRIIDRGYLEGMN